MYIPHLDAILHALGTSRKDISTKSTIEIPVKFLIFLLLRLIKGAEFNEARYLKANEDVASAVKTKKIKSGKEHYLSVGFVEGRRGAAPDVNESWYRLKNPDVVQAISAGVIKSGQHHYDLIGEEEFRAPSHSHLQDVYEWKLALQQEVRPSK